LWDSSELLALDLGQTASELGLPDQALEIIASAATIDDAVGQLRAVGLLPSEEELRDELVAWFTPLLEPDCYQPRISASTPTPSAATSQAANRGAASSSDRQLSGGRPASRRCAQSDSVVWASPLAATLIA
jgi:hypothetical protein